MSWFDDDDEDDLLQEKGDVKIHETDKDSVVFLIDCDKSMFERIGTEEKSPFQQAIAAASALLSTKIISSDTDQVGIVFYGTETVDNPNKFDGVTVYSSLEEPSARLIQGIRKLESGETEYTHGHHDGPSPLFHALWTASHLFQISSNKYGTRRVWIFTNNEDPSAGDTGIRTQCMQRARDLQGLGITFDLFAFTNVDGFDHQKFYREMIPADDEGSSFAPAASKLDELIDRTRRKANKKRPLNRVMFSLGNGVDIGVGIYKLVQPALKSKYIWLDGAENLALRTESNWMDAASGKDLLDYQIKTYQEFGGERVMFTKDDMTEIKKLAEPGIELMGFKPKSHLKLWHNVVGASFLYPQDDIVAGSSVAVNALITKMVEMDKIAIARHVRTKSSYPVFVALVPQPERRDEDGIQLDPPGFHMITLPFVDDMRPLDTSYDPASLNPSPEAIAAAKEMVKALNVPDFDSRDFDNPSLQHHYAYLQARALNQDEPEEVIDGLVPDLEGMEKFKHLVEDFAQVAFPPREADEEDQEWIDAIKDDTLKKKTIPILKAYCAKLGLSQAGKKGDLLERISEFWN